MTEEQIKQWKVERDIARQSNNPELMQKAYDHRDDLMMECISHQSDRVKRLMADGAETKADIIEIKKDLAPCVESDREYRKAKSDAKAVTGFLGFVGPILKKTVELVGAPTIAIIFCKLTGILW